MDMTNYSVLPISALLGGGAAFFLRLCQNRTGFDPMTALPVSGNFYALALPALLIAWGLGLLWWCRQLPRKSRAIPFRGAFTSAGTLSGVVLLCGLLAVLLSGFLDIFAALSASGSAQGAFLTGSGLLSTVSLRARLVPGLISVLCGLFLAPAVSALHISGKRQGRTVQGELLLIPVIALVVKLVVFYRNNSVNPSLAAYYPQLLALVLLILAFFRLASFACADGTPRRFAWYGTMAAVLCMAAAADTASVSEILFLCGMALILIAFLGLLQNLPAQTNAS